MISPEGLRQKILHERAAVARLFRYGLVGASLSILYMVLTSIIIEVGSAPPLAGSISGFALSLPVAYLGHRYITFRASGSHRRQMLRFSLTMTNAFVVSSTAMLLVAHIYEVHYAIALGITTILVPLLNYFILNTWVFGNKTDSRI